MPESARKIAQEYAHRIWDKRDLKAIDELLAKDVIIHSLLGNFHGPEAMRAVVLAWYEAFPDLKVSNELIISENDLVSIQWNAKGTHLGAFKGHSPSGKTVSYSGVTVYRLAHGKITEYWAYLDMNHLFNQIKN